MPDITPNVPKINVKALAAPGELIDRKLVAQALDRNSDGLVGRDEFQAAGLNAIDPDALDTINQGGDRGSDVTVDELARALGADQIRFSGEGNVELNGGNATFRAGRVERSQPWSFPYVQGIRTLAEVQRIAPSGWSAYNPDSPSSEFTYTAKYKDALTGQPVKYTEGMQLKDYMFASEPDANGDRWVMTKNVRYDELAEVLHQKASTIRDITANAKDPEIRQIYNEVNRVLMDSYWNTGNRRDRARDLFNALKRFDNINVPAQPETRLTNLDSSLKTAAARVEDQSRIAREIPVDRARTAVAKEVDKLSSPFTPAKLIGAVGAAGAAGAVAFFAAHLALPLVGGIALGGLALGWGIGWLINNSKAGSLRNDLDVLKTINPEANKKSLQQHAVIGYKILQDARTADTLAGVRAYTENADKASATIGTLTSKVASETQSLRNMENLVRKYAG
jgi:hypothetical protein